MSIPMTSEEMLPWFSIQGECDVYEVPSWNPATVIRTDQDWGVKFHWKTTGGLNHLLAGKFCLQVLLEKYGPQEGPTIPVKECQFESRPFEYNETIQVPAGLVRAGVYKLVAVLTMKGPLGVPGPVAGMAEGPLLNFYDVGAP
jgi:hypothetical protein